MKNKTKVALSICPNREHRSEEYSVIRYGTRKTKEGNQVRFLCRDSFGSVHYFTTPAEQPKVAKSSKRSVVSCPDPRHKGSKVMSRGSRSNKSGSWSRFYCQSTNQEPHSFQVLIDSDGAAKLNTTKPPACPEHPKTKVIRFGLKGSGGTKRQSYLCKPDVGKPHRFSPPLSREAVVLMASCSGCDELLSPHRGSLTASRHTPWTLAAVVQALDKLSRGTSYAEVSREMQLQRVKASEHLSSEHGIEIGTISASSISISATREKGKNAWRLAADLVEQYSPLLFGAAMEKVDTRERKARDVNDAILQANPDAFLPAPIVYLLDDAPIKIKQWKSARSSHQQDSWSLLVVVELVWQPPKDPWSLPNRESRLRLARAYPNAKEESWMLVLSELPTTPDFVIADAGFAIKKAVARRYANENVKFIPSLYHIQKNLRKILETVPNGRLKSGKRIFLAKALQDAIGYVSRENLVQSNEQELAKDWDALVSLVASMKGPSSALLGHRKLNEPKMLQAISILAKNPHLPASNAPVETKIRMDLEPFLVHRQHRFRNLARTNFLLDLAVARSQGMFIDLNKLSKLIRQSNEANNGWAPSPRQITDRQPLGAGVSTSRYSSLLNAQIISRLSAARNITKAVKKPVRIRKSKAKMQGVGSGNGRAKGSKNKPRQPKP